MRGLGVNGCRAEHNQSRNRQYGRRPTESPEERLNFYPYPDGHSGRLSKQRSPPFAVRPAGVPPGPGHSLQLLRKPGTDGSVVERGRRLMGVPASLHRTYL